jgi:hypothetical protein
MRVQFIGGDTCAMAEARSCSINFIRLLVWCCTMSIFRRGRAGSSFYAFSVDCGYSRENMSPLRSQGTRRNSVTARVHRATCCGAIIYTSRPQALSGDGTMSPVELRDAAIRASSAGANVQQHPGIDESAVGVAGGHHRPQGV